MSRLEIWRASVNRFNIPAGSPVDSFLKSQEEAISKMTPEYSRFMSSGRGDITTILNGVDLDKGYVLINVYGPRPYENVQNPSERDPLVDFFMTARDHFYRWMDYYIDQNGESQYQRSVQSDRNRVPSPSFGIAGRFGECSYIIDQNPTFPDDFAWQFGYERNDFRVSLERLNPDGGTRQAQFSAFYKAPNWSESRYHVRGGQAEIGNLQEVEFSSQFGHKRAGMNKYFEGLYPDMKSSIYEDSLGRFRLKSDCTVEITRLNGACSLTSREPGFPHDFRCKFPSQFDVIPYEKAALERNSDWRRLVYEVSGSFALDVI